MVVNVDKRPVRSSPVSKKQTRTIRQTGKAATTTSEDSLKKRVMRRQKVVRRADKVLLESPDVPKPSELPQQHQQQQKLRLNSKGESVLHRAAIRNDTIQLAQLLASGLSANVRDHAGWTPLHEAALRGHVEVVFITFIGL